MTALATKKAPATTSESGCQPNCRSIDSRQIRGDRLVERAARRKLARVLGDDEPRPVGRPPAAPDAEALRVQMMSLMDAAVVAGPSPSMRLAYHMLEGSADPMVQLARTLLLRAQVRLEGFAEMAKRREDGNGASNRTVVPPRERQAIET